VQDYSDITKVGPEKSLVYTRKKTGGRNNYGRVTVRARGGGHKQKVRTVDFRRNKIGIEAKVIAVEYDPIRSARLALLEYADKERRYIVCPDGLTVGATVMSGPSAPPSVGNALPLSKIPVGIAIHNIEIIPGKGGQLVRSAGSSATLMSRDAGYAQLRLPSGEIRKFHEDCMVTVGSVGNAQFENIVLGKAGRAIHRGNPNGGGQGKSKGGGGRQHLASPWGVLSKGFRTRKKYKLSNRFIVVRRDGRPMKQK